MPYIRINGLSYNKDDIMDDMDGNLFCEDDVLDCILFEEVVDEENAQRGNKQSFSKDTNTGCGAVVLFIVTGVASGMVWGFIKVSQMIF